MTFTCSTDGPCFEDPPETGVLEPLCMRREEHRESQSRRGPALGLIYLLHRLGCLAEDLQAHAKADERSYSSTFAGETFVFINSVNKLNIIHHIAGVTLLNPLFFLEYACIIKNLSTITTSTARLNKTLPGRLPLVHRKLLI